jgi:hypothetical protein
MYVNQCALWPKVVFSISLLFSMTLVDMALQNRTNISFWGPRETKGYYFYNKVEGKVFVTCNGVFFEKEFLSK